MRMCVLYCSLAVLLVCVLSPFQDHKLAQYDEVEFSVQNVSTLMCTSLHIYIGKKLASVHRTEGTWVLTVIYMYLFLVGLSLKVAIKRVTTLLQ